MANKSLLKEILSVPTYFGKENLIRNYLISYAITNNIRVDIDSKSNITLIKGCLDNDKHYPCVVAHIDTVHSDNIEIIENDDSLTILEKPHSKNESVILEAEYNKTRVGIGGDDKAGIFIALSVLGRFNDIIACFFVEEEFGCYGSRNAHTNEILKCAGYFIQFDAPGNDWFSRRCVGIELHSPETLAIVEPILEKHNILNIRENDPYTDVMVLRETFDVACFNLFAGYYDPHSINEYVNVDDTFKAIEVGVDIINLLGNEKYN